MLYKEKTGEELKKEAKKLGLSEDNWYEKRTHSVSGGGPFSEAAVQARVSDAKRARRENRFWIIAIISALASFFSLVYSIAVRRMIRKRCMKFRTLP